MPWWLRWWRMCLQCRRSRFDPWVWKIPRRRERLPTPVFWPGEFHGLHSSWGCKELDITEWLSLSTMWVFCCCCFALLNFWMLNFKPAFSLSSFTFIKRLFSSSSLSAIKGGVIHISEVVDISPGNLDSSLCFIQSGILHDVLCI